MCFSALMNGAFASSIVGINSRVLFTTSEGQNLAKRFDFSLTPRLLGVAVWFLNENQHVVEGLTGVLKTNRILSYGVNSISCDHSALNSACVLFCYTF